VRTSLRWCTPPAAGSVGRAPIGILFAHPSGDISLATAGYLTSPAGLTGPQVREFFLNPLDLETDGQMLADGLGQLIQLWHHPNPDGGGLITVAPIIELIERLAD